MDGEENESFGEVEQQLRPGSAAKDLADIWKEIGEIKQKVAEIREIQAKLFEEYVVVDSSQGLTSIFLASNFISNLFYFLGFFCFVFLFFVFS
nr:hypothetical protein Iba_chr02dCG0230 [Ipomoea batatas]